MKTKAKHKKRLQYITLFFIGVISTITTVNAQNPIMAGGAGTLFLYENDFENPALPLTATCGNIDLSFQDVNSLYPPGFQQINTVETLSVTGPGGIYSDPSGIAGNYCLSMITNPTSPPGQNDRLSITGNIFNESSIDLTFDMSATNVAPAPTNICGNPVYTPTNPILRIILYDSPGGVFDINAPSGAVLDLIDVQGPPPNADPFLFNWTNIIRQLDATGNTDGNITIYIDGIGGSYTAFDNISIETTGVFNPPIMEIVACKQATGHVFNVLEGSRPAVAYNITDINMNGLINTAGNPAVANGVLDTEISDDAYLNLTGSPVDVVYTVVPVGADASEGTPVQVTFTIQNSCVPDFMRHGKHFENNEVRRMKF